MWGALLSKFYQPSARSCLMLYEVSLRFGNGLARRLIRLSKPGICKVSPLQKACCIQETHKSQYKCTIGDCSYLLLSRELLLCRLDLFEGEGSISPASFSALELGSAVWDVLTLWSDRPGLETGLEELLCGLLRLNLLTCLCLWRLSFSFLDPETALTCALIIPLAWAEALVGSALTDLCRFGLACLSSSGDSFRFSWPWTWLCSCLGLVLPFLAMSEVMLLTKWTCKWSNTSHNTNQNFLVFSSPTVQCHRDHPHLEDTPCMKVFISDHYQLYNSHCRPCDQSRCICKLAHNMEAVLDPGVFGVSICKVWPGKHESWSE